MPWNEWVGGLRRVVSVSGRVALGIALLWVPLSWSHLAGMGWLPWTIEIVAVGITFFAVLGLAWVLGALGGILGWSIARRRGRAERGPAAGVAGFWGGLAIEVGLLFLTTRGERRAPLFVLLTLALPLLGPWVTVRWLADPAARLGETAQNGLRSLSHLLSRRLVLQRRLRLDLRGLTLGGLAGLIVAAAAATGLFHYPEAVMLAQGVRLRNEPIHTAAGPVELTRWIGLQSRGAASAPVEGRIVLLQIDDGTEAQLIQRGSEPALNALLLRKLAAWRSGPVVLPLSRTALTTPGPDGERAVGPPASGYPPSALGGVVGSRPSALGKGGPAFTDGRQPRAEGPLLNPLSAPLDPAALARGVRDLPLLARALRAHGKAILCLLPPPRGPGEWFRVEDLQGGPPVPRLAPLPLFAPLFASGCPVGSAEFEPFGSGQVPSLRLSDARGLWALPLLLAKVVPPSPDKGSREWRADSERQSFAGEGGDAASLTVGGRMLRLAAPGRFLINVYGSRPGALFPHVSTSAVLSGGPLYDARTGRWVRPAQFFRDRIVFLDTLTQPSYDTPIGPFRATELLAMATDNLLAMDLLAPPNPWVEGLLLLLCGALAGHLAIGRSPLAGALRVALLALFYSVAAAVLFIWPGAWLPVVSVLSAIGLAYLLVVQFVFTADEVELERQQSERARFEQEIAIGRAIQTSLLPPGHLCAGPFEIAARSAPAREVGGDFYNLFSLTDAPPEEPLSAPDRIGIVLGDVSGTGVQGAMYMTVATTLLEARSTPERPPEELLADANAHLYPKLHPLRMFVTVFYGRLDVRAGRLEFASAGQVPAVLAPQKGAPRYEASPGTPLGSLRGSQYERRSLDLAPGETLLIASDGFIEARSAAGKVLGYDGFLAVAARHAAADPAECLEGIFEEVRRFSGGAEETDDRTLIVVRHHVRQDLTPGPFPAREGGTKAGRLGP